MDSIRRAFGRTAKLVEKKEDMKVEEKDVVDPKEDSMNTSEDDLFSNLVVSSRTSLDSVSYHHLDEIVDLDVTKSHLKDNEESKCNDVAASAFSFMKEDELDDGHKYGEGHLETGGRSKVHCPSNEDEKGTSFDKEVLSDTESIENSISRENDSSSKFSFIRKDSSDNKPSMKICDNTQTPTKPKIIKKKKRSVKPGFGNIDQIQATTSSCGTSPGNSSSMESVSTAIYVKEDEKVPLSKDESHYNLDECNVTESRESDETYNNSNNKNENIDMNDEYADCIPGTEVELASNSRTDVNNLNDSNLFEEHVVVEVTKSDNRLITIASVSDKDENENSCISRCNDKENISEGDFGPVKMLSESNIPPHQKCLPSETDVEVSSHVEVPDIDPNINKYSGVDLSEEDNAMLKIEALQSLEEILRIAQSALIERQKEIIGEWKCEHPGEASICSKINELRQMQTKLESKEDYDEAANVNQSIMDLIYQCENYKYEYPLLDEKFTKLLQEYRELTTCHKVEYEHMLQEYQLISDWFKDDESETNAEKKLNDMTLILKEKKLKVERDKSHTSLDKEHLVKNEVVLHEEIEKQTKELNKEKVELLEKRTIVQANIAELIARLNVLEEEEKELTTAVTDIESKIERITHDFQPHIDEISKEREHADEEESVLARKMDMLVAEEEEIKLKREEILCQREKKKEIVDIIACNVENIQKLNESNESEIFSFGDTLDFEGLEFDADSELVKSKAHLQKLKLKLEDLNNQVLCNEGEEKRLLRSMNDLEAQLSELQKIKQVHVKERKYKDAKLTSDEIKSLTCKGEEISGDAMKLNESIKINKYEIEELCNEIAMEQENLDERELAHDQFIIEKLKKMNISIEKMLESRAESWTVGILELQLLNNSNIIHDLSSKHGLLSTKASVYEEVDIGSIKKQVDELEDTLQVAVDEENWERAEEISVIIEEKKKLIEEAS